MTRTPGWVAGVLPSRSIAHRNAASVLPDPVGAHNSVCSPRAMGPQAAVCAAVGSGNDVENHARTGSENGSSGDGSTRRLYRGTPTATRA